MEDLGTVSFSNKENFHRFMDIARLAKLIPKFIGVQEIK